MKNNEPVINIVQIEKKVNPENYTSDENQFYPTPEKLADKMLRGIDWRCIQTVLEPSAGKGDLICEVFKKAALRRYDRPIDAIEIDPYDGFAILIKEEK